MKTNIYNRLEIMARKSKWLITKKLFKTIKFKYSNYKNNNNLDPIFILGGSRSGTSMISAIVAQHPDVEGLFNDNASLTFKNKHITSYCISHHIWGFHFGSNILTRDNNEGIVWGHPKHISKHYRDKIKNNSEAKILTNSVKSYRKTDKIPLINSHFNMLKIGLIKNIFPKAKFILIKRHYKDHLKGWYDKFKILTNRKEVISRNIHDFPKIGLYWLTLNICALFDLKKYAKNDFVVIDYASLFNEKEQTKLTLNNSLSKIGLKSFNYDIDFIDKNIAFDGGNNMKKISNYFDFVDEVFSFEEKETS
tara:strand:+ start:3567 stop:4487 length:921 start_codon:yes stop_codon:yes gene_type:complete